MAKGEWMWYPQDFAWMLYHKIMHSRRQRESAIVPSWRTDGPYDSVTFRRELTLQKAEKIRFVCDGRLTLNIDDSPDYTVLPQSGEIELSAGAHTLTAGVVRFTGLPCLFVQGETVKSGREWKVQCGNNIWKDAETNGFFDSIKSPNDCALPEKKITYVQRQRVGEGVLFDFGAETMARVCLSGCEGGFVSVYYGESREEALDSEHCETLDRARVDGGEAQMPQEMGFRYIYVVPADDAAEAEAYERCIDYPIAGDFHCGDTLMESIYDVARRTYRLTEREFFFDGLKRDRWVWSGDVFQSEMMDFYTDFNTEVLRRSLLVLGGKREADFHINTILDYTLYWMIALHRYAYYTGDSDFIREVFPRAEQFLRFCAVREDENGFLCGKEGDWVFLDWADIDNRGAVCAEQVLYCESLRCMAELSARCLGKQRTDLMEKADSLQNKIKQTFWTGEKGCFVHGKIDGKLSEKTTRYANIFAFLFGMLTEQERSAVVQNVLKNDAVQAITTPYMKFYELSALAESGDIPSVLQYIRAYWGGMIEEGATSFWEEYDPNVRGAEKYAMYGRKYGKSLCHAWGASPLYLIGRYIAGVQPESFGYDRFIAQPYIGSFRRWSCRLPLREGELTLAVGEGYCIVKSTKQSGRLLLPSFLPFLQGGAETEVVPGKEIIVRWEVQ